MLEFIDSLPCPPINLTGFYLLYFGSFVIGCALLLTKNGGSR